MSNASSNSYLRRIAGGAQFRPILAIIVRFLEYFVGSNISVGIGISIGAAISGKSVDTVIDYLGNATFGQFLQVSGAYLGMIITVYLFMRWLKISRASIGLGRKPGFSDLAYALLTFVIYFITLAIIMQLLDHYVTGINLKQEQ